MLNNLQNNLQKNWIHLLLLLGWLAIGIGLRFTNLEEKSLSSIEVSTLGFSLGHGFLGVPLDRAIALDTLLSPLQNESIASSSDVIHRLLSESNHPPLYFLLTHWWLKWLGVKGLAVIWVGRSLSAILGAASIPAIFGLGWLAFRSSIVGQIAAALMAVSPFGIYLAQEARHYTLTILWIIASLNCLIVATRCIDRRTRLPIWIAFAWIIINGLGVATHYFFTLALCAEGVVMGAFWLRDFRTRNSFPDGYWWRIYAVMAGTLIGCLVWLPVVTNSSQSELTDWIATSYDIDRIWQPLPLLLGWWIAMVYLLPIEGTQLPVTILSGLVLAIVFFWSLPALIRGWRAYSTQISASRPPMQVLGGFFVTVIALFLVIIYGLGKNLSLAPRYHFVYFPAPIVLLGAALAVCWQDLDRQKEEIEKSPRTVTPLWFRARGKKVVVTILLMGLFGALTVVFNYGYQKSQRADLLASHIQATSKAPILIAMTYDTHAELRAAIALGMEFKRFDERGTQPKFILVQRKKGSIASSSSLTTTLAQLPRPLNLWAVNLKTGDRDLEALNCTQGKAAKPKISGYRYRLYRCH